MQVHNIQSNNYTNYNSPKFGALKVSESGQKLLNKWWANSPNHMEKFEAWKKELANTKHFDLEFNELCNDMFIIISSKNHECPNCEAPLRAYDLKGNHFYAAGTDLIDCGDWVGYTLEFPTCNEAETAYDTLKGYQDQGSSLYTINKIGWAVESVKILEKAFEHMMNPEAKKAVVEAPKVESEVPNTKLSFTQRLKNAWQALKG